MRRRASDRPYTAAADRRTRREDPRPAVGKARAGTVTEVQSVAGLPIARFVADDIGGATTGPPFGPAVGTGVVGKATAVVLIPICSLAGARTVGRRGDDTLGTGPVENPPACGVLRVLTAPRFSRPGG